MKRCTWELQDWFEERAPPLGSWFELGPSAKGHWWQETVLIFHLCEVVQPADSRKGTRDPHPRTGEGPDTFIPHRV